MDNDIAKVFISLGVELTEHASLCPVAIWYSVLYFDDQFYKKIYHNGLINTSVQSTKKLKHNLYNYITP